MSTKLLFALVLHAIVATKNTDELLNEAVFSVTNHVIIADDLLNAAFHRAIDLESIENFLTKWERIFSYKLCFTT